jgi:bleomycin hydrolase
VAHACAEAEIRLSLPSPVILKKSPIDDRIFLLRLMDSPHGFHQKGLSVFAYSVVFRGREPAAASISERKGNSEMTSSVSLQDLEKYDASFEADSRNAAAMHAVTNCGLKAAAKNEESLKKVRHTFSLQLKQGDITNQKQSGRCWMFAALNTFRFEVMKNLNLKTFELSQNYTLFYDKLEKSNYFLESVLETLDEPLNGRLMAFLLTAPVNDGGQWDMLCNLIRKYGVVPKDIMPETKASSATREMDALLTRKLREDAMILRRRAGKGTPVEDLRAEKQEMLSEIYRILCVCLGKPPKKFDFEVTDKDDKFFRDADITPQQFFERYVKLNLDDYVSLINAPTADKPYHRSYSVRFLGNVKEGHIVRYLNLPVEDLKKAAIAQLQSGSPVWFGSDVGQFSESDSGVMDTELYDFRDLLSVGDGMNKADRLDYGESLMTHAMVLQGVNLDDSGKPDRWRVENSWGDERGLKGWYVMSDAWFDEYVYQIVVNKKFLTAEALKEYESEPIMLEPWDPMGSLAD